MKSNQMILDKGQRVPLTADLLRAKVRNNDRIELILMLADLSHARLIDVRPLVNGTKMREKLVLQLFSPWLNPKPVIHTWQRSLRKCLVKLWLRLFVRPLGYVMANEMA